MSPFGVPFENLTNLSISLSLPVSRQSFACSFKPCCHQKQTSTAMQLVTLEVVIDALGAFP
eukprot:2729237-Amphidinium_carterae.1